jgi:hypothetical protein
MRDRTRAARPLHVLQMDHRLTTMRVALSAGLHARLTPDAAVGVDEEMQVIRLRLGAYYCDSSTPA